MPITTIVHEQRKGSSVTLAEGVTLPEIRAAASRLLNCPEPFVSGPYREEGVERIYGETYSPSGGLERVSAILLSY
jgi:hypothetical protein